MSIFLVLTLCLSMVPTSALAEEAAGENQENGIALFSTGDPVEYVSGVESYDENGIPKEYEKKTVTNCKLLESGSEVTLGDGWYVVNSSVTYGSNDTVRIEGTANLILGDNMEVGSVISMKAGSTLNIYGQPSDTGSLVLSNYGGYAFECTDGTATVRVYGGRINAATSKENGLLSGVTISSEPQMERMLFDDINGCVISDWNSISSSTKKISISKCSHDFTYVPSSVSGHEATHHQKICQRCGLIAGGVDKDTEHENWTDGKCSDCGSACIHTNVDASGLCTACKTQFEAKVVASDGTTTYYAKGDNEHGNLQNGLYFAINAAPDGSTIYPLRSQSVQAWLEGTGRTLTLNMNGITLNGSIYVARGSQENQTLILTGEGCIDDTIFVHEHGTLQTKLWQGTTSRLYMYSGCDVQLNGGTYGQILRHNDSCTAGSILEAGYVFQKEDDSFVTYDTEITNSNTLNNVTVVPCTKHYDSDGDLKCDYCNGDLAASVTTESGEVRYFMAESINLISSAVTYANANKGTIKLLVDGLLIYSANCTIDLNGKTVGCITAGGSDLVVTGDGTVATLNAESGSAKLYGGSYQVIKTTSITLGDLLPDGYGFQKTDGSWLTDTELAKSGSSVLTNIGTVKVVQAPIRKLDIDAPASIIYTDELKITAKAETLDNDPTVSYQWYRLETSGYQALTNQTGEKLALSVTEYGKVGDYTFKCTATSGSYVVSKEVTVTVEQADLANAELTITNPDSLVYDPDQAVTAGYLLSYNGNVLYALADGYDVSGNTATEVGTYTLTVTAQDKKNYKGTKSVTYEVKPRPLGASTIEGSWSKIYDGTTDLSSVVPTTVKFYIDAEREVSFTNGTDYSVETVDFDSATVGTDKTVTIKLKLLNKNYTFADGKTEATFTCNSKGSITQATVTPTERKLEVMNGHAKTYTVDLAEVLPKLTAPQTYGDITYGTPVVTLSNGYYVDGATIKNGVLSLPIEQVDTTDEGEIGTVSIVVSTTNYTDMTLTVKVKATNKLVPTGAPALSKSSLTYGEKLSDITLSGSMKYEDTTVEGTFAWVTPDAKPDAAAAYMAEWIFTPTDNVTYTEVKGKAEISVSKATPVGEPVYTKITAAGKTVTAAALAVNPNWPAGTVKWVDADGNQLDDSTEVKANVAYQWLFTPTDTNNYNTITGTIVLYTVSSSGGGSTGGGASGGGGAIGGGGTTGGGASAITVPVSSGHGDSTISATVEGTTATVAADSTNIDQVIADGAKTVVIDVSGLGDVDSVKLPADIISKADEAKGTTLTINLAEGTVELSQKALKAIASGGDVTISIQQAALTDAQRQAVGSLAKVAVVVDVDLYVGAAQQSRFGGGELTISIPYTPKAGEDTSKLAVWFIRDDGTIETKNGTYDAKSGCFVFKTKHLSRYLLVDTTQARIATDTSAKIGVWTQVVMFFRKFLGK